MFAGGIGQMGAFYVPSMALDGTARKTPDPTPIVFPSCAPQAEEDHPQSPQSRQHTPLVALLQSVQRPADIQLSHFCALGLHVISDASPQDILPDASYLPSVDQWTSIPPEDLEAATISSKKPLNNGGLSPGLQTYLERRNELSIDNTAAFRTIRRIPPPAGETTVRLGNAYEFFKNLEVFSGFWIDTSLPPKAEPSSPSEEKNEPVVPTHLKTHHLTGTGSQLPPDCRQHLLTAFVKLVAYDFGCNVSYARVEPRLYLTPPAPSTFPPSYFTSSAQFVYRTPCDRASARTGIVEGPLAAISCRATTGFATEIDSQLDLAREIVAVLLTAQQRAREGKEERRAGDGKWWTNTPRWGGGPGGAIGKEFDKAPSPATSEPPTTLIASEENPDPPSVTAATRTSNVTAIATGQTTKLPERSFDVKRNIGGMDPFSISPSPFKKSKRGGAKEGNLAVYENYRKMLPPSSSWDRKARYESIGKASGMGYDDIFLVSALNHHVCVLRCRVPDGLLGVLGGEADEGMREWGRMVVWRSRWYDLFLKEDRIIGMGLVWGMMSWLMRAVDHPAGSDVDKADGDEMDAT